MRLLVLGGNGLLGSNVIAAGTARGLDVVGTYHSTEPPFDVPFRELDITDDDRIAALLESFEIDVVVNCAAMTDVDACESNVDRAHAVNAEAPGRIAELCDQHDVRLVHVSTDYVFDGETGDRYRETDPTNPVQVYGRSKLAGERAVRAATRDAIVVRLSFVYGIHRGTGDLTGFPAWVHDRLSSGESTRLFVDQHVTPSRAGQVASTAFALLATERAGTVHVAARSCVTPYEFGERVRQRLGADAGLLDEGPMEDVDRAAVRPAHTCLCVDEIEDWLGRPQPTLERDLDAIQEALGAP